MNSSTPDPRVLNLPLNKKIIKSQSKGGRSFDYVEASTVTRILDAAFGDKWSFKVVNQWSHPIADFDIIYSVHGSLTVGDSTREYIASTSLRDSSLLGTKRRPNIQKTKLSALEPEDFQTGSVANIWKMTVTDCLKKCASQFGVAAELYSEQSGDAVFNATLTDKQKTALVGMREQLGDAGLKALIVQAGLGTGVESLHTFNVDKLVEEFNKTTEEK